MTILLTIYILSIIIVLSATIFSKYDMRYFQPVLTEERNITRLTNGELIIILCYVLMPFMGTIVACITIYQLVWGWQSNSKYWDSFKNWLNQDVIKK